MLSLAWPDFGYVGLIRDVYPGLGKRTLLPCNAYNTAVSVAVVPIELTCCFRDWLNYFSWLMMCFPCQALMSTECSSCSCLLTLRCVSLYKCSSHPTAAWHGNCSLSHTKLMITRGCFRQHFWRLQPPLRLGTLPSTVSSILATHSLFDSG